MKKKTSISEYLIHKKIYNIIPKYTTRPISYRHGILISETRGISLKRWLKINKYNDAVLMRIIRNVMLILKKIQARYPKFRHMDLHLDNLLIHRGKVLIIDFDKSKFTSSRKGYDVHFFMNSMRHFLLKTKKYRKTLAFLNKWIPKGCKGHTDKYVKNYRLRPDVSLKVKSYNGGTSAASIAMKLLKFK
jgi:tRNA A-37 threonylcarbamoyl transferase component Bud32